AEMGCLPRAGLRSREGDRGGGRSATATRLQSGRGVSFRGSSGARPTMPREPGGMTMTDTMLAGPAGPLRAVVTGAGDATPVLFAHSFAGSSAQWALQLDHVSAGRRAVALD